MGVEVETLKKDGGWGFVLERVIQGMDDMAGGKSCQSWGTAIGNVWLFYNFESLTKEGMHYGI